MAVRVDDERRDHVQLVARGELVALVDGDDRVDHDLPALGEERVEDLLLRVEVVVDEPVGHARLVRDVGHAAVVEALPREHGDRGVEDHPALVDLVGHQTGASTGQR